MAAIHTGKCCDLVSDQGELGGTNESQFKGDGTETETSSRVRGKHNFRGGRPISNCFQEWQWDWEVAEEMLTIINQTVLLAVNILKRYRTQNFKICKTWIIVYVITMNGGIIMWIITIEVVKSESCHTENCDLHNVKNTVQQRLPPFEHSTVLILSFFLSFTTAAVFAAVLRDWLKTCVKSLQRCLDKERYWLALRPHSTPTNRPLPQAMA